MIILGTPQDNEYIRKSYKVYILYINIVDTGIPTKDETLKLTSCIIYLTFRLTFLLPCNFDLIYSFSKSYNIQYRKYKLSAKQLG